MRVEDLLKFAVRYYCFYKKWAIENETIWLCVEIVHMPETMTRDTVISLSRLLTDPFMLLNLNTMRMFEDRMMKNGAPMKPTPYVTRG